MLVLESLPASWQAGSAQPRRPGRLYQTALWWGNFFAVSVSLAVSGN